MNIYEKLLSIQTELKAPKGQRNDFGKYNYRSCEDILEAVKPICNKNKAVLILSDELVNMGERYYIKATATLYDIEESASVSNSAYARESENKKGMDDSQITGTASSYARKYALNGLFNIDDTKDSDTNEYLEQNNKEWQVDEVPKITSEQITILKKTIEKYKVTDEQVKEILDKLNYKKIEDIPISDFAKVGNAISKTN